MKKETNSRTENVVLNLFWACLSQIIITLAGLYNRKVFLEVLGSELLGVNSLFSDVLSLFSFADLGFGTAIMFSLYKPIAENNTEKVQALLRFYQYIYWWVIGVITIISISFFPFLGFLHTELSLKNLRIYYIIYQKHM